MKSRFKTVDVWAKMSDVLRGGKVSLAGKICLSPDLFSTEYVYRAPEPREPRVGGGP